MGLEHKEFSFGSLEHKFTNEVADELVSLVHKRVAERVASLVNKRTGEKMTCSAGFRDILVISTMRLAMVNELATNIAMAHDGPWEGKEERIKWNYIRPFIAMLGEELGRKVKVGVLELEKHKRSEAK